MYTQQIMFPDSNSWNRIVTEPSSPRTNLTMHISSQVGVVSECGDHRLQTQWKALKCKTLGAYHLSSRLLATPSGVAVLIPRWVASVLLLCLVWGKADYVALKWSTTSVWPFWLDAYAGLKPSCIWQQQKIVRVWNTISTDSMCLKFKAEHAENNTHHESLLHEKVLWYWLWSVQQRIHTAWCIHCCCTWLLLHTTVLYIVVLGMKGCQGLSPHNSPTASPYPSYSEQHPSFLEPLT